MLAAHLGGGADDACLVGYDLGAHLVQRLLQIPLVALGLLKLVLRLVRTKQNKNNQ
jgi:hypothetical protein